MPLVRLLPVLVLLAGVASAASPQPAPFELKPGAAIVQYAAAQRIPLDGVELTAGTEPARPGDLLTVLFTIQDGAGSRQWLGEFQAAALTPREAGSKPDTGLGLLSAFQSTLHTDTGHAFSFPQSPFALEIRTHGPFGGEKTGPVATSARVLATRGYLEHGLAPMGEIEDRLRTAGKKNPRLSYMYRPKYSEQQIAASTARAAEAGFTEDDERAYAQGIFALMQFAHLAFRTEGVDGIIREIADSPTLLSGAFTNFDWNNFSAEDGAAWGLPDVRVFRVPYDFLSRTKAKGAFYIAAPRPPLQNTAGIIGLTVDETSKAPGKRLIMRVLAGRRAWE